MGPGVRAKYEGDVILRRLGRRRLLGFSLMRPVLDGERLVARHAVLNTGFEALGDTAFEVPAVERRPRPRKLVETLPHASQHHVFAVAQPARRTGDKGGVNRRPRSAPLRTINHWSDSLGCAATSIWNRSAETSSASLSAADRVQ